MKKQDFKLMHEVAHVVPKMMDMSESMFNAVICSTISVYGTANDIDISEMLARITSTLLCDELELEEEGDDDEE